jgi:hypothetical protein
MVVGTQKAARRFSHLVCTLPPSTNFNSLANWDAYVSDLGTNPWPRDGAAEASVDQFSGHRYLRGKLKICAEINIYS